MIEIAGGGPAGSAAALAALADGAAVRIYEKSPFPRHKVCGEFLSPEVPDLLDRLGVHFEAAPIRRAVLHLGRREKTWALPGPAWGLSRYALDRTMLDAAVAAGAELVRSRANGALISAHGLRAAAPAGTRLFGFKAHFCGPADDRVELFFFSGCYIGVSPIEGGMTNVCGLAPERLLRERDFAVEALLALSAPLRRRIEPLRRTMHWLITGPVVFQRRLDARPGGYAAGDALGFVDPFTGTGILRAMLSGRLAGQAAARGHPPAEYLRECARMFGPQHLAAALFRAALESGLAHLLVPLVPGPLLFRLTRPRK